MLTTPDNLLFLHLLGDDTQKKLFHDLSRDGVKVDQPVVSCVLLFEHWNDIGFPLVLRQLPCSPGPFEDDGEVLSNDICQLPEHSWVYPIRAHGFIGVQFA